MIQCLLKKVLRLAGASAGGERLASAFDADSRINFSELGTPAAGWAPGAKEIKAQGAPGFRVSGSCGMYLPPGRLV